MMSKTIAGLRARKPDQGFTLIELLVVVVIIGVLVAIAVPVYLNYRQGAADKSAQSDVRGALTAVEEFYTDNGNTYPATRSGTASPLVLPKLTTSGTDATITLSDKSEMVYVAPSGTTTTYRICARNTGGSGKYYVYDSALGGSVKSTTAITDAATFAKCGA